MGNVVFDMSMSLDGFITGAHKRPEDPLGDAGQLHDWKFPTKSDADAEVLDEVNATPGAIVVGRRMFDEGVEPWGDPPPFHKPVFVVTHRQHESMPMQGGTTYTFVTGGIEAALEQAKAAAGDKDVAIWGGANLIQQCLKAGLIDKFEIHLIPVLLGGGDRLFDHLDAEQFQLKKTRAIDTSSVTHLQFTVVR